MNNTVRVQIVWEAADCFADTEAEFSRVPVPGEGMEVTVSGRTVLGYVDNVLHYRVGEYYAARLFAHTSRS